MSSGSPTMVQSASSSFWSTQSGQLSALYILPGCRIAQTHAGGGSMRPYEGIKIIDITHVLAGPFAAYQLGLLGADVIKVEHPKDYDQSRDSGGDRALNRQQMGTGYLTQASNKRAITLNLKHEKGRDRALVRGLGEIARPH